MLLGQLGKLGGGLKRVPVARLRCAASQSEADERTMGASKKKVFAVARGRETGLFHSWSDCERQVKGFHGNLYRGFATEAEASAFLSSNGVPVTGAEGPRVVDLNSINSLDPLDPLDPLDSLPHVDPPASCERALMFFDGASKRNPGDAGFGAVIFDRDSSDTEQAMTIVREVKGFMPEETNNVAEYSGLIAGLAACLEIGVKDVHVKGDSKLVINQVNGHWKVKNENLMRYHRVARRLADRFEHFKAEHVYREFNTHADRLSNEACVERHPWHLSMAEDGKKRKRDPQLEFHSSKSRI